MRVKTILYTLLLMSCNIAVARAQETGENLERHHYTMERIRSKSGWLESDNPAGLIRNEVSLSTAEAGFDMRTGTLHNVADGRQEYATGIRSESYQRRGKLSLHGILGYRYTSASDRSWAGNTNLYTSSMAMGDSIPGNTRNENYFLGAGVAYRTGRWTLGAAGRYEDQSLAKRRDSRNKTTYMNLSISPGAIYSSKLFDTGLSFTYGRTTEEVYYDTFGTSGALGTIYLFEGLWFYVPETLDNGNAGQVGYEGSAYKGAVQSEWRFGQHTTLFTQFSAEYSDMKRYRPREDMLLGDQQSMTYRCQGILTYTGARTDQQFSANATFGELLKYNNIQGLEFDPTANNNVYIQYGRILKFTQRQHEMNIAYRLYIKRNAWNSSWIAEASYSYFGRQSMYMISPARYEQRVHFSRMLLTVTKNLLFSDNSWLDVKVGGGFTLGGGTPLKKWCPNQVVIEPENYRSDLLEQEFHFLSDDRIHTELGLRYTHNFTQHKIGLYADLKGTYIRAVSGKFTDSDRKGLIATLGLNF